MNPDLLVESTAPRGFLPLRLDEPIPLDIRSAEIDWGGFSFHLIQLNHAQCQLSRQSRLTCEVAAVLTHFDRVHCHVHAAVFSAKEQLLAPGLFPGPAAWL